MSFNSRSKEGIAMEKDHFKLLGATNPTVEKKSIKNLGKRIDHSLRDTIAIQETKDNLEK